MFDDIDFIDLTHTITESMPTWSGGCGFNYDVKRDYDSGIRILKYHMHAAAGTHMDAPSHFFREGKNIADISLNELIVPCVVLDVSDKRDENLWIEPSDIAKFEKEYGKIQKGSFVIGYTGWQDFWYSPEKYRNQKSDGNLYFPGFSKESAKMLLEREIMGIGIDTLSPDGSNPAHPVHHALLGEGKYIVENMMNLHLVPKIGAYIFILPSKIGIGAEASVRCIVATKK